MSKQARTNTPKAALIAVVILVILTLVIVSSILTSSTHHAPDGGSRSRINVDAPPLAKTVRELHQQLEELKSPLRDLVGQLEKKKEIEAVAIPKEEFIYHEESSFRKEETIFVSVSSFRDAECAPTVRDIFEKARKPHNIYVGILEQNNPNDSSCIDPIYAMCNQSTFCPTDQIRIRRINANDAKGPTGARYLSSKMYRGETYFMMIDSHNRFVSGWDEIVIRSYKKAPSKKPILSHYPEAWGDNKPLDNRATTTFMCGAKFINDGYLRFDGIVTYKTSIPRLQPYSAAGFLFAKGELLSEVPFDPHLPFLFDGEEFLYTVRMWTHGWDIYSPNENILYHYYYREKAPKFWSLNNWVGPQRKSVQRVQFIAGITHQNSTQRVISADSREEHLIVEVEKYGLGTVRTIQQYWEFAKIKPESRVVNNNWCKKADEYPRVS